MASSSSRMHPTAIPAMTPTLAPEELEELLLLLLPSDAVPSEFVLLALLTVDPLLTPFVADPSRVRVVFAAAVARVAREQVLGDVNGVDDGQRAGRVHEVLQLGRPIRKERRDDGAPVPGHLALARGEVGVLAIRGLTVCADVDVDQQVSRVAKHLRCTREPARRTGRGGVVRLRPAGSGCAGGAGTTRRRRDLHENWRRAVRVRENVHRLHIVRSQVESRMK
ncbi:hypothetical protein ON010_g17917 [Phytophthora cinnamomi]|nr:hypothetical protein ON010_g17917 [Phytophthora cinnamomi]